MEKVVFADSWQPIFVELGLKSFDDFFGYRGGKIVDKNNKRDVYLVKRKLRGKYTIAFLKILSFLQTRASSSDTRTDTDQSKRHSAENRIKICLYRQHIDRKYRKHLLPKMQ